MTRTFILAVKEIVAEIWQQTQQRRLEIEPRVHRGWFPYPLLRAYTNVLQRELEVASTIQDLYSGRPVIYTMFLGYDEVAHHSGIERPETLRELAKIDRAFARLARAAEDAPRPYRIVVLADHGQSQGATFKQRYGLSLGDLVTEKCGADEVLVPGGVDEGWGYLNAAATEAASSSGVTGTVTRLAHQELDRRGRHRRHGRRAGRVGPEAQAPGEEGRRGTARGDRDGVGLPRPDLVPADRGAGHARATRRPLPRTSSRRSARTPESASCSSTPTSTEPSCSGASGTNYLDEERIEGDDPLASFGPNAALHVKRTDTFPHCQDIMVNSTYWTGVDEVAAFEELCGSHGGMGGTQNHPFILCPSDWAPPSQQIVGAENVHLQFVRWLADLGHTAYADLPDDPHRLVPTPTPETSNAV